MNKYAIKYTPYSGRFTWLIGYVKAQNRESLIMTSEEIKRSREICGGLSVTDSVFNLKRRYEALVLLSNALDEIDVLKRYIERLEAHVYE